MVFRPSGRFIVAGIVATLPLFACGSTDSGTSGGGGGGNHTSSVGMSSSSSGASGSSSSGASGSSSSSGSASSSSGGGAGLACPASFCTNTSGTCTGGYAYHYGDGDNDAGGTSTASLPDPAVLCVSGTTEALPATPTQADYKTIWGGGLGINLNQPKGVATTAGTCTPTGTGVSVSVSNLPAGGDNRVVLNDQGKDYCYTLKSATETIPWSSFNTTCWDGKGTPLAGAPTATHIQFQVVAASAARTFNFCVTALSL